MIGSARSRAGWIAVGKGPGVVKREGLVATLGQVEREAARAEGVEERERRKIHANSRATQVQELNENLELCMSSLQQLLEATLRIDHAIDFESMKQIRAVRTFEAGDLAVPGPPPDPSAFTVPALRAAYTAREEERMGRLRRAVEVHERRNAKLIAEMGAQHKAVDSLKAAFEARDPRAVVRYFSLVLDRSSQGADFPNATRMAYLPESKEVVVESLLPPVAVVPTVTTFTYVRASDTITPTPRPATQRKSLYAGAVAQIALRTIYQLFDADGPGHLETVVFSGYVDTVDPATGLALRPCLISVRAARAAFGASDLAHGDAVGCLHHLGARVSKSPAELSPVRPLLRLVSKKAPAEEIVLDQTQEQVIDLERGTVTPGVTGWVAVEARQ